MAVRFDAAADRLLRTATVLDYQSTYAWGGWFYVVALPSAGNSSLLMSVNRAESGFGEDAVYIDETGQLNAYVEINSSPGTNAFGSTLSTSTWYHLLITRESSTSFKLYLNGTLDATNTTSNSGRSASAKMESGGFSTSNNAPLNGRTAYHKAWTTSLGADAAQLEYNTISPRNYASLFGFWPLFPGASERTVDYSGNGASWSTAGTLTDEDAPPVGWGSNPLILLNAVTIAPTLEQEGYRVRNDNGSETTATWAGNQDTLVAVTQLSLFRLRVLVNASGDPTSKNFSIQYKRSTEGAAAYRSIPVKQ